MTTLNEFTSAWDSIAAAVDETLRAQEIDLTNCDREPIHIPNTIQPHGVLLTFDPESKKILQVSCNIEEIVGRSPQSLVDQPLSTLFSPKDCEAIGPHHHPVNAQTLPLQIQFCNDEQQRIFEGTVQSCDGVVILELEPLTETNPLSFFEFYRTIKQPMVRLQSTETLLDLCQVVVQEVQALTQFDRVMVYRFLPDGSGVVIAESKPDEAEAYLGLRYPATDVPKQAKQLYALNWLRMIPTVDYQPIGLFPDLNPVTGRPLNMSLTVLRSVSPMHLEYLANMGVQASMSISLLRDRQLWGLIACHHAHPKPIHSYLRSCCEFLGQVVSSELGDKAQQQSLNYRLQLKAALASLGHSIASSEVLRDGLTQTPQLLMDLVQAQGVAVLEQHQLTRLGLTPSETDIQALLPFLDIQFTQNSIYHTDCLARQVPEAIAYRTQACGLLALCISQTQKIYLLWFRPELLTTVDWAGNPHKQQKIDDAGEIHLSPRHSFEKWTETVHLQSEPWQAVEIEIALEFRRTIIGIVLQKVDDLAKINLELTRSNDELAAFAYVASHDLKAPLRAIANLASWLKDDLEGQIPPDSQQHLELLQSRVYRMDELINGLLDYSRVGRKSYVLEPVEIHSLVQDLWDSLSPPPNFTLYLPTPTLTLNTYRVLLEQVLANLMSNAIKYVNRPDGQLEISIRERGDRLQFQVQDNGPGIAPEYHQKIFQLFQTLQSRDRVESTGVGLAIVKKVVEGQGGQVFVHSSPGEGCCFTFTWPKAH